jgi:hypothetical protein
MIKWLTTRKSIRSRWTGCGSTSIVMLIEKSTGTLQRELNSGHFVRGSTSLMFPLLLSCVSSRRHHEMFSAHCLNNRAIYASNHLNTNFVFKSLFEKKKWWRCLHLLSFVSRYWERRFESHLLNISSLQLSGAGFRYHEFRQEIGIITDRSSFER